MIDEHMSCRENTFQSIYFCWWTFVENIFPGSCKIDSVAVALPREQRLCKACESGATEDEEHFLFDCNAYTQLRQTHLNPQNSGQHCDNRLQQLFANHDPLHITTYLKTAYDLRDKIVNFHVSQVSMCGMKITLARGQGKHIDKPVTKLQTMMEQNNKLRISRKGKRHSPYP